MHLSGIIDEIPTLKIHWSLIEFWFEVGSDPICSSIVVSVMLITLDSGYLQAFSELFKQRNQLDKATQNGRCLNGLQREGGREKERTTQPISRYFLQHKLWNIRLCNARCNEHWTLFHDAATISSAYCKWTSTDFGAIVTERNEQLGRIDKKMFPYTVHFTFATRHSFIGENKRKTTIASLQAATTTGVIEQKEVFRRNHPLHINHFSTWPVCASTAPLHTNNWLIAFQLK